MNSSLLLRYPAALAVATLATIASSQTCVYTVLGDGSQDQLGFVVRAAGDVNGDGVQDFIAGMPGDDNFGQSNAGSARVYSGSTGLVLHTVHWTQAHAVFGRAVDGAGDVDGDGFGDFIVGAPEAEITGSDSGAAVVYSGSTGATLYQMAGADAGDVFGASVAGLGDLDGDGHGEFAVGAPFDATVGSEGGSVTVYSGVDGAIVFQFYGAPGDNLGRRCCAAGDVDGDGVGDFMFSAQEQGPSGFAGYVEVRSGADGSILWTLLPPIVTATTWFGSSIAGCGDVNRDGFDDLIVGDPVADLAGANSGAAYVYSGKTGLLLHSIPGMVSSRFGEGVSGAGDIDGDHYDDFVVGASDQVDPQTGDETGAVFVFSGFDGTVLMVQHGDSENDRFGGSVSGIDDVTGDGLPNILVGARSASLGAGLVRLYSTAANPVSFCSAAPNSTGSGSSIGSTGSVSMVADNFELIARGCPATVPGLFFFGTEQERVPFGDGLRCVGGEVIRLAATVTDRSGELVTALWTDSAAPGITSGFPWKFQAWYRDPTGPGGTGFNLSDGLSVVFCP